MRKTDSEIIYEKNIEALKQRNFNYEAFKEKLDSYSDCNDMEPVKSKNGMWTLKASTPKGNMFLHSSYDPQREAREWADRARFDEEGLVVVYGLGLGYHVKQLFGRLGKKNRLLVLDPDPRCFELMIRNLDVSDMLASEQFSYSHSDDTGEIRTVLRMLAKPYKSQKISILEYMPIVRLHQEYFNNAGRSILDFMTKAIVNVNTVIHFSRTWVENMFLNLGVCMKSPGIKGFFGVFEKKPAIIISAGPSLDKNKHLLKQAKGKAFLICVGTALKSLLSSDIYPDVVISIDGGLPNVRHFEGLPEVDVPLIIDPTIHYKIPQIYKANKIVTNSTFALHDFVEDGSLISGESVACMAFDLARQAGADPIIFVGQDLAYTGGRTHSRDTVYGKNNAPNEGAKGTMTVKDIYGYDIITSRTMYTFKLWFEDQIKRTEGRSFIDATEGGARIEGTEVMTLRQAIDKYCYENIPFIETVRNLSKPVNIPKQTIDNASDKLNGLARDLSEIMDAAKKGRRYSEKLLDIIKSNSNTNKINSINKKLDDIDKSIKQKQENINLLNLILQPVIKDIMLNSGNDEKIITDEKEKQKVAQISVRFYESIYKECEYIKGLIKKAVQDLKQVLNSDGDSFTPSEF